MKITIDTVRQILRDACGFDSYEVPFYKGRTFQLNIS